MLHQITWGQYALVLIIILLIYYGLLVLKFYGKSLLRKNGDQGIAEMQLSLFQQTDVTEPINESPAENWVADEIDQLLLEIREAAATPGGGHAPLATLRHQLKTVLQAHPKLIDSPHRPAINEMVVSECEKNGCALLSEAEVDQWWEVRDRIMPLPGPAPMPEGWPK